jgi:secreted PhoX family phosphatase
MSAHGASIVEIRKVDGRWQVVPNSAHARRISTRTTVMRLSGPAAGHPRLRTAADPSGTRGIGTLNNCAGGVTPWGTVLTCEENFHGYFMGSLEGHPEERNYQRYSIPGGWYAWGKYYDRFDITKEPNEANRFGWVVEVDPYDPTALPIKRTALGRFKHEGGTTIINRDGRLVIYSGDDQRFEYLYKYVSHGIVDRFKRSNNVHILDQGTLFVARFHDDGRLEWLPLVWGAGPLTAENGFHSQADVLIETRRTADLLGATPMDRPEDVEPNAVTQKVYVILTHNLKRKPEQVNAANPRPHNLFGHIIELTPPHGDHAAQQARWDILIKCGDPRIASVGASYHPETSANGWFASPDNCAIDHRGNLWVSTDQGGNWYRTGTADGIWAVETEGELRGLSRMFFRVPVGAELCGPLFTPDDTTLFLAVQHPAADGTKYYAGFARASTYDDPATRWPDFQPDMPPRPAVVVITKADGGVIGS